MIKDTELKKLTEIVQRQKKNFKIEDPPFSYRFDSRTGKLIYTYSLPETINIKGEIKTRKKKVPVYVGNVNRKNWKRFFKDRTTIVRDHHKIVKEKVDEAYNTSNNNFVDDYDFGWWKETYFNRKVGNTKTMKPLSPATIKSNIYAINQYYKWLIEHDSSSLSISSHIEKGADWFEKYYMEKITSGKWKSETSAKHYREVRGFYNFIGRKTRGKFPIDILKVLEISGKGENERDTINSVEFEKIMDFIHTHKDDVYWGKFILLLRLQIKTGMRVGELVSIRNRNIDLEQRCIWITGKTGKRKLNFNTDDDDVIWNDIVKKMDKDALYLFYRTKIHYDWYSGTHDSEYVIDKNLATSPNYYTNTFRKMRDKLGLRGEGVISSHSIRRYFITEFHNQNPDSQLIRQIVGHTSARMTEYYVGNRIKDDTKTTLNIGV